MDLILKEKLNKQELKTLLNLVRGNNVWSKLGVEKMENLDTTHVIPPSLKHLSTAKLIIGLYEKAGLEEQKWIKHWEVTRYDQKTLNKKYKSTCAPARQDNKTYINKGNGYSHPNKIRYPRKARKTAWKRFYKLFPHLKPENT